MILDTRHVWAIARRVVRQHLRSRLSWWTAALVLLVVASAPATGVRAAASIGGFATCLAAAALAAGAIGDDLQSGAVAADALAGVRPASAVIGTIAGLLAALAPSVAIAAAVGGRAVGSLAELAALLSAVTVIPATFIALVVCLGAALPGKANAALAFPLAIAGAVSPLALPLSEWPAPLARLMRALWGMLPLPHRAVGIGQLAGLQQAFVGAHLVPAIVAGLAAAAIATFILHRRAATGRWS